MASDRTQWQIDRLLDEAEEASAERNWEDVLDRAGWAEPERVMHNVQRLYQQFRGELPRPQAMSFR